MLLSARQTRLDQGRDLSSTDRVDLRPALVLRRALRHLEGHVCNAATQ